MNSSDKQWSKTRLRNLVTQQISFQRKGLLQSAEKVSFLPMEAIGEKGELDLSHTRDKKDVQTGYTLLFNNDVLIAKITPCFENGKGALATGLLNGVGFGTTELHVLSPKECLDSKFLYYVTVSYTFRKLGEASMTGAAGQKRVPTEYVHNFLVDFPPLSQQRQIADYLDCETEKLDALIAAKKRLLELLAEKRRALITQAVTRGLNPDVPLRDSGIEWLGKIPEDWKVVSLSFLGKVRTGVAKGRNLGNAETVWVSYLRVANVQDGYFDLKDVATIEVLPDEVASFSLQKGDVLMNEGGDADKLGRGAVWHGLIEPCLHQNHVFAVRCHSVEPDWLATVTSSDYAKSYFESRSKQSTNLASISSTNLKELPVVLPPREMQQKIVQDLRNSLTKLDCLCTATETTINLLQERRTSVISAAVTGQLQIPD